MCKIDFDGMRSFVIDFLKSGLDEKLVYHSLNHTLQVEAAALKYAKSENISNSAIILLRTAALFHDSGYVLQYKKNEPLAVQHVVKYAPNFGYSPKDIEFISQLIMATASGKEPQNIYEKILCDADHDYLGSNDYQSIAKLLETELNNFESKTSDKDWILRQIHYLENEHKYYTNSAKLLRQKNKESKIIELKKELQLLHLKK